MLNISARKSLLVFLLLSWAIAGIAIPGAITTRLSADSNEPPIIVAVYPTALPNATNTYITITGQNFAPTPTLTLGSVLLSDVTFVNSQTLTALVRWGLEPGNYPLTVTNPDGQSDTKDNACTVYQEDENWSSAGPYGGNITGIFIDPANPNRVYADANSSGLFVSDDAAAHWSLLYLDPMPTELAFQTCEGNRYLYLGAHDSLMRSSDDGATWERFIPPGTEEWYGSIEYHPAVNPAEPTALYVGITHLNTSGGLFKYNCTTGTWTRPYPFNLPVTAIAFEGSDHIYFGTRDGKFYASADGGNTWAEPVTVASYVGPIAIDSFPNGNGVHNIWVAANGMGVGFQSVFLSQDGGESFQPVSNLPSGTMANFTAIHPFAQGVMWLATGFGVFFTTDNGAHWSSLGVPWTWHLALFPDPQVPEDWTQTTVYAATWKGVYKNTDGGQTWEVANQGLTGIIPEAMAVNPQNPDVAYASTPSLGIIKTYDGGRHWQVLSIPFAGYGNQIVVDPFAPQTIYIPREFCDTGACLYISQDGGETYQEVVLPRPAGLFGEWWGSIKVLTPDPERPGRLLVGATFGEHPTHVGYGVIYVRESADTEWQVVKVLPGSEIRDLYFDPHNPQRVYAGTDLGLYRSQDRGVTWEQMSLPADLKHIGPVVVHPDQANVIYIYNWCAAGEDTRPQGIYISQDGGATWRPLTDQNGNQVYGGPVWEMAFAPVGPRVFHIATFSGLYRSLDDGHTLTPVEGLPGQANVRTLVFGHDVGLNGDERLVTYVGTTGGYRITHSANLATVYATRTDLMGAGIYRSITMFRYDQHIYLPLIVRR